MASTVSHRAPRTGALRRRAGRLTLAGATSVTAVGLAAPTAAADDHSVWDRVADCESTGNWDINTGNGFYGGLQFWHPTWTSFGGGEFAPYAHQATKLQQITVAQRVLKVQGPGAWPVCSVRAGLTMSNGLAPYGDTAAAPTPDPGVAGTWWVSASPGANVRSGPSTSYAVVGAAAKGSQVSGALSNGWVKLADGRGWIAVSTLTDKDPGASAPDPAPAPPSAAISWTVTATAGANVRSGPSTSYAVVGGLVHGARVHGELSTNGWVRLTDGSGWVSGSIMAPAGGAASGTGADSGQEPAPVERDASTMAPLTLDGSMGPLTVTAVQRWVGLPETGRWDATTIRAVQAEVGTRADGAWGPMSQVALQDHVGLSRDGSSYLNHRTVVALQAWLNAHVIG
ncbi:MAG TPA: transglycosylase family protein [Ornithinimicrobium sp.]|nr:transglycosylase family protein [Ornithinimicrobium sp.]